MKLSIFTLLCSLVSSSAFAREYIYPGETYYGASETVTCLSRRPDPRPDPRPEPEPEVVTANLSATCSMYKMTVQLTSSTGTSTSLTLGTTSGSVCEKFAGQIGASRTIYGSAETFAVCDMHRLNRFSANKFGELKDGGITSTTSSSACEDAARVINSN